MDAATVVDAAGAEAGVTDGGEGGVADGGWVPGPKGIPARPDLPDTGLGEAAVFALRDVVLEGDPSLAEAVGYDLDGWDTQAEEDPTECVPPVSEAPVPLDGEAGIDNQFARELYPAVDTNLQLSSLPSIESDYPTDGMGGRLPFESVARQEMASGRGTWLLVIRDYGGESDDPQVDVSILEAATGAQGGSPCNVQSWDPSTGDLVLEGGEAATDPAWSGGDCFWPRTDGYVQGDPTNGPIIRDQDAYVAGHTLVMRPGDNQEYWVTAGPAGLRFMLAGTVVTAELGTDGSVSQVLLGGRWPITNAIGSANTFGICDGSIEASTLTALLRQNADLHATPPSTPDLGSECDAISTGIRFDRAEPVSVGDPLEGPSRPNPCGS